MSRTAVPAMVLRGGTSRGVFLQAADLPADREARSDIFTQVLGSPDPAQVDGLGGGMSSTSKVMVVEPASQQKLDLRYEFAQVAVGSSHVAYDGNCGNLSAAVAVFALSKGMCPVTEPVTHLRMLNLNTDEVVTADVPCRHGQPVEVFRSGHLAGPDPDSDVVVGFAAPQILASGIEVAVAGRSARVSLVGGANPAIIVDAQGWVDVEEAPSELNQDLARLDAIHALREAAVRRWPELAPGKGEELTHTDALPRVTFVRRDSKLAVSARSVSMGRFHHAVPVTVATAIAAAIAATDSPPKPGDEPLEITIRHPKGTLPCTLRRTPDGVLRVGIGRSVRTVMEGLAYYAGHN